MCRKISTRFSCCEGSPYKVSYEYISLKIDKNLINLFPDKYHGHHGRLYSQISSTNSQTGIKEHLEIDRNQ